MNRRSFIKSTGIASLGLGLKIDKTYSNNSLSNFPIVIATWDVKNATKRAWEILSSGGNSLDAVELGSLFASSTLQPCSTASSEFPPEDKISHALLVAFLTSQVAVTMGKLDTLLFE